MDEPQPSHQRRQAGGLEDRWPRRRMGGTISQRRGPRPTRMGCSWQERPALTSSIVLVEKQDVSHNEKLLWEPVGHQEARSFQSDRILPWRG